SPHRLHLAIAPPKNPSRFEWMVEKITELGIDAITPIVTGRSEKFRLKQDRLQKIAISALKQSGNSFLPTINKVTHFGEVIPLLTNYNNKFIAHCQTEGLPHLAGYSLGSHETVILIGPEGDFTLDEIDLAVKAGFTAVSLGNSRLRTETAGFYVTTLHNILKNRDQ
ncbi:MAG: RNA methyltransferase, partial [Saprospiraceae bacterium]|nr:RNA methyltransferase [Saprospiraceae bacterium]